MAAYGRLTTSRPKTTHHSSRQRSRGGYDDYSRQAAPRPETSYNTHPQRPPQKNGSSSRRTSSRPVTSHHTDQEAPHSSRNVNTNHHTTCLVSFDDPPLTLNVQHSRARRSDVYDVPESLQNIMKLDDWVISKRLKKRLCSAGRVYCGNNILNLHKRMYERPRPGSSQYQWSSTKCTMILPTIVRGPARAKTAGPARNRNSHPEGGCPRPWTAVEKKRNNSPEPDTRNTTGTKETHKKGQEKEGNDRENARETNANANANANTNTKAKANANVNVHVNANLNANRDSSSQSSDSSSGSDSSSSSNSSSSDEEQREGGKANTPSQKKKANKQRRSVSENKSGKTTDPKGHVPGRDGNQRNDGVRFSKPRGLNSDDDYSTDSSESSRDDKRK